MLQSLAGAVLLLGWVLLLLLAFALAGLVILQSSLSQHQLISGLYTLSYPLRYIGLSRARVAVRLALTLHYAESSLAQSSLAESSLAASSMRDTAANWRTRIEQMLVQAEVKQQSIELQVIPIPF